MVEVEEFPDQKYAICRTSKRKESYILHKDMTGYSSFVFKVSKGSVPETLSGTFTSIAKGVEAFRQYDREIKMSQAVKREIITEERKAQNAKLHAKSG